jgi:L-histidine N-alpha-methyltransferase
VTPDAYTARAPAGRRANAAMVADVRDGLLDRRPGQRALPPKYFYDHRGSQLFDAITRLPEYYLTRTERALLTTWMPTWMQMLEPGALVEFGAGSADKTRTILDAMRAARPEVVYVPVDVSAAFLDETAERVRDAYPGLRVVPMVADFVDGVHLPQILPHPVLFAMLGSTIGNLEDDAAVKLLRRLRQGMTPADRLLLGADLLKSAAVIEPAYNDAQGVTAAFNRNMLHVLNHELGANFHPDAFAHEAFLDPKAGRIEMHLVATTDQRVTFPGVGSMVIPCGDSIRTEISNKYTRQRLTRILCVAGLDVTDWVTDESGGYALLLAGPSPLPAA